VITFLVRRALFALLLVFVVSSAALLLTRLAPGAVGDIGINADPEERARLIRELGFDRPLHEQYVSWLANAVRLDFGPSIAFSRPVSGLLTERAFNTAVLAFVALIAATLIGIPMGVFTGSYPHDLVARILRAVSLVVLSIPPLVGSLALVLIASRTGWLPIGGMTSTVGAQAWGPWLGEVLTHLPLPALALAAPLAATLERLQSQSIADAGREPFVHAALARGVTPDDAVWRHAWPVSLAPVLGLYGVAIGSLFSGSFVVEVVTAWPGLGRLMYDALRARDVYLVAGCAASGAFFLAIGTFIADLLQAVIDPRRREATR
jgi:peptide/nickel transport system permease protein